MSIFSSQLKVFLLCLLIAASFSQKSEAQLAAQPDSILFRKPVDATGGVKVSSNKVSTIKAKYRFDSSFVPRKATIRSAILPGLGQIYNRQIWKVPLVYGAIGTTAGIFIFNVGEYKQLRQTYIARVSGDSTAIANTPDRFKVLSNNSVKFYRDQYRRNVDYSVLAFLVAWGLNVVDATVSAHLRQFDVSDDLTLKLKPTLSPTGNLGIGLVMNF